VAPRARLALAIHNHQPVGNFGWVFAEVYDRAYLPMLEALERHPGVRLSLHYTGPLLDGFFIPGANELDRVIDRERERLGRLYSRQLECVAEYLSRKGDHTKAVDAWLRIA
jgi:hypothetical protein